LQSTELNLHTKANRTVMRVGEKIGNNVINESLPFYPRLSLYKEIIKNNLNNLIKT